ncbi:MAG TPA: ABC transporter ATP-binding protein, partial [Actinocrinis sp.]|nr:ABC transporter ATP-binding protein [Actinocrinis sp.]
RRNVGFGLRMRGIGRAEIRRRVDEALRLVQLSPYADRLPGQLSGGQQQRVAIARAVVIEPPLVLMDEPLSNLDAALRLEMRTEIRRLHQSLGLTTVYVTHDQEEALSLADRLVVLDAGRVAQIGAPAELYETPKSAYVAAFMGYRNILSLEADGPARDGTVGVSGRGLALRGTLVGDYVPVAHEQVTAALRPEDVRVVDQGGFDAVAEVVEYHGRGYHVDALTPAGDRIHLRTEVRVAPGDPLSLSVVPERVLVFPAAPSAAAQAVAAGEPGET